MSTIEDAISRMTTTLVPLIIMGKNIDYKSILVMMVSMFIPQIIVYIRHIFTGNPVVCDSYVVRVIGSSNTIIPYNAISYVLNNELNLKKVKTDHFIYTRYLSSYKNDPSYEIEKDASYTIKYKGHILYITTGETEIQSKKISEFVISSSHSVNLIKEYIRHCCDIMYENTKRKKIVYNIYDWSKDGWSGKKINVVKNPDYVMTNDNVMEDVIKHIDTFYESKEIYDELCLAYKKGIILCGTPGSGKTSIVYSTAYKYKMNIYKIDGDVLLSPQNIEKAFKNIPNRSIVLCDDFDSYVSRPTYNVPTIIKHIDSLDDESGTIKTDSVEIRKQRTEIVGKLLEIFDAYNHLHECIIFMTTNYIEDIDPAITRPGRFDIRYDVTIPNIKTIRKIVCKYLKIDDEIIDGLGALDPEYHENIDLSSAKIINTCIIPNINDYDKAIFEIQELLSCKNIQE